MMFIQFALLAPFFLRALAQDTSLAEVKKAFADADIPNDLSIKFGPSTLLHVSLPQTDGTVIQVKAGVKLPRNATAGPPSFAISGALTLPGGKSFVVAAVDPDAPTPQNPTSAQIRHFLGGDFRAVISRASNNTPIVSKTPPVSPYRQPNPPAGSDAHRYVFLLFVQSPEFANQTLVNSTTPVQLFNISSFAEATKLGNPIGGTFWFTAPNPPATAE